MAATPQAFPSVHPLTPAQSTQVAPSVGVVPSVVAASTINRIVPDGAPGWSSSVSPPTADVNPHYVQGPFNYDLLVTGIVLLSVGYLTALGTAALPFTSGIDVGVYDPSYSSRMRDSTCHQTLGALMLIPVVGTLLASFALACQVPVYREVDDVRSQRIAITPTGETRGIGDSGYLGFLIPSALFQLTGLALMIPGILEGHSTLEFGSPDAAAPQARLSLTGPGGGPGLSLRVDF